jgi:CubicO group peptidase (beta-lactamase class C family)
VRAGRTYEALLHDQITGPLGMTDTGVTLTASMRARFLTGHDERHAPVHAWNEAALAGAGGIRSTAGDMLTYLEAQLHPDHLPRTATATSQGKTLAAAVAASHVLHGEAMAGMHIALNWFRIDDSGVFWHDGATGGFSSSALFDPAGDYAVVVLSNTTVGDHALATELAKHVSARLTGKPAPTVGAR